METMMRCGVVGLSGYTGKEAFSILLNHPQVRVNYVAAYNTLTEDQKIKVRPTLLGLGLSLDIYALIKWAVECFTKN